MRPVKLLFKPLRDGAPVYDVPDSTKVLGFAVLVLQVVGVLPSINSKERLEVTGDRILISSSNESQRPRRLVLDKPRPARALNASKSTIGLLL